MPERSAESAGEALRRRRPTSHERQTGVPWDASYQDGPAPWDLGRPQPAIVRVAADGGFVGPLLDVGCGTGENALHLAALGLSVLGVDVAATAVAIAREKTGAFNAETGWSIEGIEPALVETRYHDHGAAAWFATITRL